MNFYVASSWRNLKRQKRVVRLLRSAGHGVYDFSNPEPGNIGFAWSEIDAAWKNWSPAEFKKNLMHPLARSGFKADWRAMVWADACVLVIPCGRSAHLEAGYFVGAGKPLIILLSDGEPELMYKMADVICCNETELTWAIRLVKENYDHKNQKHDQRGQS